MPYAWKSLFNVILTHIKNKFEASERANKNPIELKYARDTATLIKLI
jgi:hypothetical protein